MNKPAATKTKIAFSAAALSNLRAASGEGQGEPLALLLSDIDEDPDQPRRVFDEDELAGLADSIRALGVLQPIVVRPPEGGRYRLAFGARRYRAAKLAELKSIPAVVRARGDDDYAEQLIENQQRSNLSNSELAGAIERLARLGKTSKQIGVICALKEYQVAAFRVVGRFPEALRDRLNGSDVRALYDLYRQWVKTPEPVLLGLAATEAVTVTEARRIIEEITGRPTGSIVLDKARGAIADQPLLAEHDPTARNDRGQGGPVVEAADRSSDTPTTFLETTNTTESTTPNADDGLHGASSVRREALQRIPKTRTAVDDESTADDPQGLHRASLRRTELASGEGGNSATSRERDGSEGRPVFIVQSGEGAEVGRLLTDKRAEGEGWALVAFDAGVEEVPANRLRIVRIE